jgi:hypothetical protein
MTLSILKARRGLISKALNLDLDIITSKIQKHKLMLREVEFSLEGLLK